MAPVRECFPVLRVYILCQHPFIVFSIRFRRSVFSNIQSCCLLKSTTFRREVRRGIFGSGSALMSKSSECNEKRKKKYSKRVRRSLLGIIPTFVWSSAAVSILLSFEGISMSLWSHGVFFLQYVHFASLPNCHLFRCPLRFDHLFWLWIRLSRHVTCTVCSLLHG